MGTTADKLNKILETKQAIRQAIITKGVDVGEDTKFADYPSKIAAIQTGSGEGTGGASDAFFNMRTQNGTNMYALFTYYPGSELDLSTLDTSKATDMSMMFSYCWNISSLDLSSFNTINVNSMYQMFAYSNFNDINLSSFDTRNVQNMTYMFQGNSNLQSLDLSHFNTNNVTDMMCMFNSCGLLHSINVSGWDTSNVGNMMSMFQSCGSLQSLNLSHFNTNNVSNMYGMFDNCTSLQSLDISGWNTAQVNNMSCMFNYCYGLTSIDLSSFNTINVTDMSYMFQGTNIRAFDLSHFRTGQLQNTYGMFAYCNYLEEVNMSHFDMTNVNSCDDMFGYCPGLHTLRLDNCNYDTISKIINSSNFPTGEATTAEGYPLNVPRQIYVQEANATGLTAPDGWEFVYVESGGGEPGIPGTGGDEPEIPTPGIPEGPEVTPDPEEPTQTYQVNFSAYNGTGGNAKKLTVNNVDVSDQVVEVNRFEDTCSYRYETTEPITQVSFKDNTDLIRLFSLDSSNITDMSEMFDGCTNFVSIVGYIDCGAVTNMNYMFRNCTSLSSIPDSHFTSMANVTDMTGMYYNCSSMTGAAEASKYWGNSMVGGFAGCFHNCTSLDNYSDIPFDWGGPSDSE